MLKWLFIPSLNPFGCMAFKYGVLQKNKNKQNSNNSK